MRSAVEKGWSVGLTLFCLFLCLGTQDASATASDVQRMRLPVGNYWLSGPGSGAPPNNIVVKRDGSAGYSFPAYCVDEGRKAPTSLDDLAAVTGDVVVQRYIGGVAQGPPRQLSDVVGDQPGAWFKLTGRAFDPAHPQGKGLARRISIAPLDSEYDYHIEVKSLAIVGKDREDVEAIYKPWSTNEDLVKVGKAWDSVRRAIGFSPTTQATLDRLEAKRQSTEWELFGADGDNRGGKIPAAIDRDGPAAALDDLALDEYFYRQPKSDIGQVVLEVPDITAGIRADWITLSRGGPVPPEAVREVETALAGIGLEATFDSQKEEVDTSAILAAVARLNNLDRAVSRTAGVWRNAHLFSEFYSARTIGVKSFAEAVRTAAYSRFDDLAAISKDADLETLERLHCWSAFTPSDAEIQALVPYSVLANGKPTGEEIERSIVGALPRLRDLMRTLGLRGVGDVQVALPKVKVSATETHLCFQWILPNGELRTEVVKREELSEETLRKRGRAIYLVDEEDDRSLRALEAVGGVVRSVGRYKRDAAAAAMQEPNVPIVAGDLQVSQRPTAKRRSSIEVAVLNLGVKSDALGVKGDAGIVRLPDGSVLLVDTGLNKDSVRRLQEYLKRSNADVAPVVRMVITHTDSDHMGGLADLLEHNPFPIAEIVIGRSRRDAMFDIATKETSNPTARIQNVRLALQKRSYLSEESESLSYFWLENAQTPRLLAGPDAWRASPRLFRAEKLEFTEFYPSSDTKITLYHVANAKNTNDAGIVTKVVHKQDSWLLTDDLTPTSMRTLLECLPRGELEAGYIRYPHHLWFPPRAEPELPIYLGRPRSQLDCDM